ncbi:MAG: hypothetical protein HDR01_05330 [Lachnospiraceae bacterium]|nr:hypothetical protein [Lachnospiraceae bacterium]
MPDGITIVLDPGHGGENLGLNYNGHVEKEMNLIVANAMREELLKYDNVNVYLTHEDDRNMSLKERAVYGKEAGADVLISLHFNMSEEHTHFGSEVWIPSKGLPYRQMHSLGDVFLEEFEGIGLHTRGVKTRLNDRGTDYYGIIRESEALDIPAMIVEHCYADYKTDTPYIETTEELKRFGQLDARAVAKYYGLTSKELGVDYSSYVKNGYYIPEEPVGSDATGPVDARIYMLSSTETYEGSTEQEKEQGISASFLLSAREEESKIAYYSYSLDGGENYTELFPWQGNDSSMVVEIEGIQQGDRLVAKIYNGHTVGSETNLLKFGEPVPEMEAGEEEEEIEEVEEEAFREEKEGSSFTRFFWANDEAAASDYRKNMSIFFVVLLIIAFILGVTLSVQGRKEKIKKTLMVYMGAALLLFGVVHGIHIYVIHQVDTKVETLAERKEELPEEELEEPERVLLESFLKEEDTMSREEANVLLEQKKQTEIVYDIAEGYLRVETLEGVPRNSYDFGFLTEENGYKAYRDSNGISAIRGIDVSKFQGSIDWQAVKESGMEFAMIRIGIRGYGSGEMVLDERFYENLRNAQSAGLRTGVYFFSAAVTEEEAVEEAEFVLKALEGYEIDMPIVFDTEPVYYADARTDDLTPVELTDITIAFCERIKQSGHTPMIYANAKRLTTVLHLEKLSDYQLWYADYQEKPLYPYQYTMWQYTEKGTVPGIQGNVDIDLYFQTNG